MRVHLNNFGVGLIKNKAAIHLQKERGIKKPLDNFPYCKNYFFLRSLWQLFMEPQVASTLLPSNFDSASVSTFYHFSVFHCFSNYPHYLPVFHSSCHQPVSPNPSEDDTKLPAQSWQCVVSSPGQQVNCGLRVLLPPGHINIVAFYWKLSCLISSLHLKVGNWQGDVGELRLASC